MGRRRLATAALVLAIAATATASACSPPWSRDVYDRAIGSMRVVVCDRRDMLDLPPEGRYRSAAPAYPTPVTLLAPGEAASGTDCGDTDEPSEGSATMRAGALDVVVPERLLDDLPRHLEWVAWVMWKAQKDTPGERPVDYFLAFVPEQPASYEGWQPNHAEL